VVTWNVNGLRSILWRQPGGLKQFLEQQCSAGDHSHTLPDASPRAGTTDAAVAHACFELYSQYSYSCWCRLGCLVAADVTADTDRSLYCSAARHRVSAGDEAQALGAHS
jgi:hypothetical protein